MLSMVVDIIAEAAVQWTIRPRVAYVLLLAALSPTGLQGCMPKDRPFFPLPTSLCMCFACCTALSLVLHFEVNSCTPHVRLVTNVSNDTDSVIDLATFYEQQRRARRKVSSLTPRERITTIASMWLRSALVEGTTCCTFNLPKGCHVCISRLYTALRCACT